MHILTTIIAPQVSGQITYVSSEFCGTKKEVEAYTKAGTICQNNSSGNSFDHFLAI